MRADQKKIYIVRHGETDLNRMRIVQGSGIDADLNDLGRQQAKAFYSNYWQQIPVEVILVSALQRTYQTMLPFIEARIPFVKYPELNEINWGIHEGLEPAPWIADNFRRTISSWKNGDYDARIEAGESAHELAARVERFIEMLKLRPEQHILICSHGRTMRCLLALLEGKTIADMENYRHDNTGMYQLDYQGGKFTIEKHNDVSHLKDIEIIPSI
ncbi:MAG: histidine phosphatase family protein [Saprospiraceae bacterium]